MNFHLKSFGFYDGTGHLEVIEAKRISFVSVNAGKLNYNIRVYLV